MRRDTRSVEVDNTSVGSAIVDRRSANSEQKSELDAEIWLALRISTRCLRSCGIIISRNCCCRISDLLVSLLADNLLFGETLTHSSTRHRFERLYISVMRVCITPISGIVIFSAVFKQRMIAWIVKE